MKIKMNRFFIVITFILSMTVFSCKGVNIDSVKDENQKNKNPTVKVVLNQEKLRTAFPEMSVSRVTEFKLEKRAVSSSDDSEEEFEAFATWTTDDEESAYQKMHAAELPIAAGNWEFKLTASCYASDGTTLLARYSGTCQAEIGNGQNSLQFTLKLESVNVTNTGNGTLTINIILGGDLENRVKKITGTLLASDRQTPVQGIDVIDVTATTNSNGYIEVNNEENPYVYTLSNLASGIYYVKFDFYADTAKKVLLGTYKEAVNINSLGATSTIEMLGVESEYSVEYFEYVLGRSTSPAQMQNSALPATCQTAYSRNTQFNFGVPEKTGYTFWKWVQLASNDDSVSTSAAAVTGIARKSIGNRRYCAIFIPNTEVSQTSSIQIAGTAKVGYTLTATAKYTNDSAAQDYLGTIVSWKWFYSNDDEWEEIPSTEVTNTDEAAGTDNTAAVSSIKIKPAYAGKQIKVQAVQKYKITKNDSGAITSVTENSATSTNITSSEPTAAVANGTLDAGTIVLKYTATPVRSTALGNNFEIESGYLTDANDTSMHYDSSAITSVSYNTETGKVAPLSRGTVTDIPITFEVPGYDSFTPELDVLINVKYLTPDSSGIPTLEDTIAGRAAITYGKYKFTGVTSEISTTIECKIDDGEWSSIPTGEITLSESATIKFRKKATGTANQNGYIVESDPYTYDYTAGERTLANNYIGTKVVLGSVAISGTQKVGNRITATASPDISGQNIVLGENLGRITWTWKDSDNTELNTETTYPATSTYDIADASLLNKTITVTAVYEYLAASIPDITKTATTSAIAKGTLSGNPTYTYGEEGEQSVVGASLVKEKVNRSGTYTNALNTTITPSANDYSFSGSAPNGHGNVTLKINVPGYEERTYENLWINVRKAAPASTGILSTDVGKITLGAILFQEQGLQYRYSSDDSWHDASTTEVLFKANGAVFAADDTIDVRYKVTETTGASGSTTITIATSNIGTRGAQLSGISITSPDSISLTASNFTISVNWLNEQRIPTNPTYSWYIDDIQTAVQTGTSSSYTITTGSTGIAKVNGTYSVHVVTHDSSGTEISATATVNVTFE